MTYTRLPSGLDVALLPTTTADLVTARIALGTGSYSVYERQSVTAIISDMLPAGTKRMTRSRVRTTFELLGAHVSVSVGTIHMYATVTSRKDAFVPALKLLFEVLAHARFTSKEFVEAKTGWLAALENEKENTLTQGDIALSQALFRDGHPHWNKTTDKKTKELQTVTLTEVSGVYPTLLSTIGGLITIAGDIETNRLLGHIERATRPLPTVPLGTLSQVHSDRIRQGKGGTDIIVTCRDKMNVDVLLGIPLTLTKYDDDFEPLSVGVSILGGSSSSRLFNELRTRKSLTYGSYASLDGFTDGYPGYLNVYGMFANDVLERGRTELKAVVRTFIERGVTMRELTKRKEELLGKFVVGLSTTSGLNAVVFDTLLSRRPLSYIDELSERIKGMALSKVQGAIRSHLRYEDAVTVSAGGIDMKGKPLS